jgi:hypothetical protein
MMKAWIKSTLILILVLSLFTASLPGVVSAATSGPTCLARYTVKSGDTLGKVADKYQVKVVDLVASSKLQNPYTIYVGQTLCIPSGSKPESTHPDYANALAADFKANLTSDKVNIRTSNFPKSSAYYVKVAPVGSSMSKYVKIGQLKTKSGGVISAGFLLTKEMKKLNQMSVCLKNVITDAQICRIANK